jgi:pilus assembly protein Flp/PilA
MLKLRDLLKTVEKKSGLLHPLQGQGLVEYALVLMLVAIVVIAILVFLGPQIGNMFSSVTKSLS